MTTKIGKLVVVDCQSTMNDTRYPHFRRNYVLGIANGVLFNTGLSFFNRTTVIPVFLALLGAPSVVIALTALFEVIGWHLPQLVASKFVLHRSRKMPLYTGASIARVAGLAIAIGGALQAGQRRGLSLGLFVTGYALFAIAGGFSGLVFTEVLAKTCPPERRGSYFGWRQILSGILGLYLGVNVIRPLLKSWEFPTAFVLLFVLGAILIGASFVLFSRQIEPEQEELPDRRSMAGQFAAAMTILRRDLPFRRFVIFRCLMNLWIAGVPFYVLMARERFGVQDDAIGVYVSWEFGGMIVANLLWSHLSDRIGNRLLLIVACALALVVSLLVLLLSAEALLLPIWIFGGVFFLSAAVDSGIGNGGINYALEIVPEGERPTYIGTMNSLLAIAFAVAAIIGGLRDIVGYTGLYAITCGVALIGTLYILQLPEPRNAPRMAG